MAQITVQGFGQDTFSLRLPAGYRLVAQTSPGPGMMAFGFESNQRSDGTRSLIQVTLIDLDKGPGGPPPPLDEIAASMIGGVRQRRDQWKQAESTIPIDGVTQSSSDGRAQMRHPPSVPQDKLRLPCTASWLLESKEWLPSRFTRKISTRLRPQPCRPARGPS